MASNNSLNNQALNGFTASGGNINISSSNGSVDITSGTGNLFIGDDTSTNQLRFGTGGGGGNKTTYLGSSNSASTTYLQAGTSGLYLESTNGTINIGSVTGDTPTINIGNVNPILATPVDVNIGCAATTSTTTIRSGTGGVQIGTFLNLPTTTSSVGQIKINDIPVLHAYQTSGFGGDFFVGTNAGNFTGSSSFGGNTACGVNALTAITSTWASTAVGANAGYSLTSGLKNTFMGYDCGRNISDGAENAAFGHESGFDWDASANYNIAINSRGVSGDNNTLRIGAGTGTGAKELNKSFIHGIRGITTVNNDAIAVLVDSAGQLGTVSSSIRYKENVSDMGEVSSHIYDLRPVTFDFIGKPSHKKQVGLIAEEVEQIMPSLVAYNQDGEVESVKYHDLPVLLLNEIQKAIKRIELLESKIKE